MWWERGLPAKEDMGKTAFVMLLRRSLKTKTVCLLSKVHAACYLKVQVFIPVSNCVCLREAWPSGFQLGFCTGGYSEVGSRGWAEAPRVVVRRLSPRLPRYVAFERLSPWWELLREGQKGVGRSGRACRPEGALGRRAARVGL